MVVSLSVAVDKDPQVTMPLASESFLGSCVSAQDMIIADECSNTTMNFYSISIRYVRETTTRQLPACLYGSRCEKTVDNKWYIGGWATSPGGDGIYLQVSRVDHPGLEDQGTTARL